MSGWLLKGRERIPSYRYRETEREREKWTREKNIVAIVTHDDDKRRWSQLRCSLK